MSSENNAARVVEEQRSDERVSLLGEEQELFELVVDEYDLGPVRGDAAHAVAVLGEVSELDGILGKVKSLLTTHGLEDEFEGFVSGKSSFLGAMDDSSLYRYGSALAELEMKLTAYGRKLPSERVLHSTSDILTFLQDGTVFPQAPRPACQTSYDSTGRNGGNGTGSDSAHPQLDLNYAGLRRPSHTLTGLSEGRPYLMSLANEGKVAVSMKERLHFRGKPGDLRQGDLVRNLATEIRHICNELGAPEPTFEERADNELAVDSVTQCVLQEVVKHGLYAR
ncbi:MAG: hypothetical protein H6502_01245 [Candidatus Woesearchaeota archaeon]|nr:MAG: hypothetical protein H6502_01245 [Candidatus Woesearchaeota archaeon]